MVTEAERRELIFKALRDKGAQRTCYRCEADGDRQELVGYSSVLVNEKTNLSWSNFGVLCVVFLCAQCGNVTFHAVEVIGLVPKPPEQSTDKKQN